MKIKANEFRIGNLIDTPYGILLIYGISKNCIEVEYNSEDVSIYDFNLDECKPIPITEEWLLKFGFKDDNTKGYFYLDLEDNLYIYYNQNSTGIAIKNQNIGFSDHSSFIFFKHVHTLQNLYFALTGNELEIFD